MSARAKVLLIGTALALIAGLAIATVFTFVRYQGGPLASIFGESKKENPHRGKLAFDKNSNTYLGVIRSEGYSTRRGTNVFYIERAGGQLIEVPKGLVEIREPQSSGDPDRN